MRQLPARTRGSDKLTSLSQRLLVFCIRFLQLALQLIDPFHLTMRIPDMSFGENAHSLGAIGDLGERGDEQLDMFRTLDDVGREGLYGGWYQPCIRLACRTMPF